MTWYSIKRTFWPSRCFLERSQLCTLIWRESAHKCALAMLNVLRSLSLSALYPRYRQTRNRLTHPGACLPPYHRLYSSLTIDHGQYGGGLPRSREFPNFLTVFINRPPTPAFSRTAQGNDSGRENSGDPTQRNNTKRKR